MADKKKKINSALSAAGRAASKANSNVADQLKKKKKSAQQAAQMQESQKKLPSWYGSIDTSRARVQQRSTTSTAKGRSVFAPQQQTTTQTASPASSMWPIVPKKTSAGLPSLAQVYGAPYRGDFVAYLPSRRGQGTLEPSDVTGAHYAEWMSDMADQKAYDEYRQQMVQSAKPQMKYQQHYNFETDRKRVERLEYQLRFENDPEERQRMQREIDTILAGAGTHSPEANEYARQYYQEKQDRADRSAARARARASMYMTAADTDRATGADVPALDVDEGRRRIEEGLAEARRTGNQVLISAYENALESYDANPEQYAGLVMNENERKAYAASTAAEDHDTDSRSARAGVYQSKANQYYLDMDRRFGFTAASQQPDFKEQSKAPKKEFTYAKAMTVNGNPMLINQPFEDDYHWDYMTDEEKATAIYLFNTKGEGTAKAYIFDYLGPGIDKVYAQDQQAKIYDEVSGASGLEKALYSGASVLTNAVYSPMSYLNNAGQVVGNLIADKRGVGWTPVNSYGEFSRAARNTRISRQAVADSMGSVGAFFYQTGMSMLDNMILLPTGQTGTLGLMALEAADAQYAEDIDNGVDPETAAISGAIAGGIETLTETVSLEHLFKAPDVESFLRGLGKQAIFEGSEEGASDVLNLIRERALYGETSYGTTEEEHRAWFKQLLLDIAGGAVSGAGMYAGYGGPQYVARRIGETKAAGQQVLANDNGAALAQAYTDATGKPANAPRSVFQTGRVLQKTLNQGAKNYNATYAQETGDAAVQYYQDNQPKDQEADKKASETVYAAIRKVLADKKLTRREQAAMDSIPGVREAVAAYQKGGAMEGTVNREGSAKIKRGIENALLSVDHNLQSAGLDSNVEPDNRASERMQQTAQGVQEAAQERKAMMQMREGESAQSQVDGQDVELLGMTGVGDKATLNVRGQDGQVHEVSLNDVTYGSDRKATAYAIGADMENTALANSFVATLADNQVPARVAAGMQAAYDYAYGGAPSVESLKGSILTEGLNDAQLNRAFELGQQARQSAVQVAQETKMKQALKQANVEWKGGTVDTSRVDMASLNAEQQRQVNLVQLVAGVTGINVELFQSKADANGRYRGENGSYNAATNTIRLDVNAGANSASELSRVTLLRTMSHELTHALQQNSPAQYDALKRAVLDVLTSKSGASIEEMAARMRERDSSLKDDGAALDEVVAEACENMLRDSDAMEQLIAQHPAEAKTFLEKVKQFFTDIVNAIRAAFGGSDTSRSREATALMQQAEEYLDICEKWSKALQDTVEISGRMDRQTGDWDVSERFDKGNEDIRYQMRDDDDGDQGLVGIFDEVPRPGEAHIDQRTWDNMSDRRVHSFMNDYPASRMWLARMASVLQSDVAATTAGQRFMNEEGTFMGQKRDTTPLLAEMKDSGYTWQQMSDVFGKMAEVFENGDLEGKVPETAIWKRAELILDRAVTEGYTDMNGIEYRPDAGYMRYKDALPGAKAREIPANAVDDTFEDVDNRLAGGGNAAAQTGGDGERVQLQGDTSYQEKQQSAKSGIALMDGGPSNRELLSSALESAAQTPEELRYVQSYKKQAQKIAEMEGLLAERRAEVQQLQGMKKRTADQEIRMKNLQTSIAETESMIDKRDKGLLKMEAMEPLRNVLDRERANYRETLKQAKKDAAARQREKDAAKLDNTLLATQMHEGREWAAKLHDAENRVAEANQKVEDLKAQSLADRMHESSEWAAKLRKAENQLATAKRQLETAQMQRIAERMAEGRKWAEKLRQAKERSDQRAARLREQSDQRVAKIQDKADRRTLQGKIIRRVKALDTMLRTPSNTRHVPDALRGATANILQYFTDESKIFKAEDMQAAANAYAALNTEENGSMAEGMYDPDTYERMVALMEVTKKGHALKSMTLDELMTVDKVLQNLSHIIQNANAVFVNGKRRNLEELVNEEQHTLQEKGRYGSFTLKDNAFVDMLRRGNITAPYFFKHLGGPLGELGTAILNGETAFGVETGRATERFRAIEEKYHRDAWKNKKGDTLTLKNGDGDKIQLTREQAMSVWATWKREHSVADRETHHLDQGGILLQQEKKLFKKTYAQDSAFRIGTAEMVEIDNWLTQEQKNYVDEVVSYLSNDIAELGNITSNALHGYSKFGEGYYYPFRTSDEFRPTKIGKDENAMPLKLMGFTKSVRSKSNAPVIVTDFTSTAADHINSMLTYYAFAEAQDNFMRLYNFRMDHNHSIKRSLSGAYGANPGKFIRAFMNDMYGGVGMSMNERDANRFLGAFKKGAVMASLSVAIQQPSSIMRAMALIDPKYFVGSPLKGGFSEAKKYAGTAVIKDMGSFDTATGRSAVQYITGDGAKTAYGKFSEKVGDVGGWLPEKMDAITWGRMWSAVKRETAARTGLNVNSEELKVQAGKRFDEVMRLTQVYDSTLAKSELMREKNMWAKMVTAFMAEATVTYNMLMDAVIDAKGKRFGAATKSVGSVIAATILNTLLSSVIYAMRDDDDKDATYFERYVKSVVGSLDPIDVTLNLVPMVKDVYEIFRGYDVERTDMSVFNDIYTYSKVLSNPDKSWFDRLKSGVSLAGIITGIPAKNIWRDIEGTVNTFKTVKDTDYRDGAAKMAALQGLSEWAFGPDVSKAATIDKLVQAMAKGDQAETAAQMKTLSTFYEDDEKKRNTTIKKAGKEAYLDGDLTDAQALRVLEGIGITGDEADKVLLDWQYGKKTGGKTVSGAGSVYLEGEIDRETALDALSRTGAEEEDVETRMRKLDYQKESGISYSGLQDAYRDGRISRAEALRVRTEVGGQKPDEAEKTLLQWDYEKDTGRKWADMQKDYAAGTITDKQAVDYLVKYGDKKSDAASETVAKWKYEKSTGKKWDEMQDDYLDGSLTKAQAMSAMQKYGGKTEAEAYWTVDEWEYMEANPDADGYSKFHRVTELAGRGQSISGAVQEIYSHSDYKTAKDCGSAVTSALTSYWKPLYIAATPAQREQMEPIMLAAYRAAYETLGEKYYGDKRRLKAIRKWLED